MWIFGTSQARRIRNTNPPFLSSISTVHHDARRTTHLRDRAGSHLAIGGSTVSLHGFTNHLWIARSRRVATPGSYLHRRSPTVRALLSESDPHSDATSWRARQCCLPSISKSMRRRTGALGTPQQIQKTHHHDHDTDTDKRDRDRDKPSRYWHYPDIFFWASRLDWTYNICLLIPTLSTCRHRGLSLDSGCRLAHSVRGLGNDRLRVVRVYHVVRPSWRRHRRRTAL